MLSDLDIYRTAKLLIEHHVDLALIEAARHEDAMMDKGDPDGVTVWRTSRSTRPKLTHRAPRSKAAKELIDAQPIIIKTEGGDSDLVFTLNGENPVSNISRCKTKFDKAMLKTLDAKEMPNWTLHDLRRTAKTLMQRAGVRPDISERVLGHVSEGVEGTYDRYDYLKERREALEALAGLVERIVSGQPAEVVRLRG